MVQNKYLDIAKKLMIFVIIVDVVITFFNIILSMIGQTDNPLLVFISRYGYNIGSLSGLAFSTVVLLLILYLQKKGK